MKKTVLVVEDEPLNRKLMRDILTHRGTAVIEAGNGLIHISPGALPWADIIRPFGAERAK